MNKFIVLSLLITEANNRFVVVNFKESNNTFFRVNNLAYESR